MTNYVQPRHSSSRGLALLLCLLLAPPDGWCYQTPGAGSQPAGSITALNPAATRNGAGVVVREQVEWNDQLQTDSSGRLRLNLRDGSILSLGSNSSLRVVQHNPASQQTTLDLLYGRLRSQVVKLTQPNSRFEVRTPTAVAGVIGTDFMLIVTSDRTTLIVFEGVVQLTPLNGAGGAPNESQSVKVTARQQVEVTAAGVGAVQAITEQMIQQLIQQTAVSRAGLASSVGVQAGTHNLRNALFVFGAVAAAAVASFAIVDATHTTTPLPRPPSGPGIPPQ